MRLHDIFAVIVEQMFQCILLVKQDKYDLTKKDETEQIQSALFFFISMWQKLNIKCFQSHTCMYVDTFTYM